MWRKIKAITLPIPAVAGAVFLTVAAAQAVFWTAAWQPTWGVLRVILIPPGLLLAALAAWICARIVVAGRRQAEIQHRLDLAADQLGSLRSILGANLDLNDTLAGAVHEDQVMETALRIITNLTRARGASFVPLDEWGRTLPAYTHGNLPPAVLRAWTEHLTAPETRQACRECQLRHMSPGSACPLASGPSGEQPEIHCLSIRRGERQVGMVNIYAPLPPSIGPELSGHLTSMMNEAVLAVEAIRLRNRELAALRQVQAGRIVGQTLADRLHELLGNLRASLNIDAARIYAYLEPDGGRAPIQVDLGEAGLIARLMPPGWSGLNWETGLLLTDPSGRLVGASLRLPGAPVAGVLLLGCEKPIALTEQERALLLSAAGQAAVLIANERTLLAHEYRAVIQERARLAREIHDGLAQTLAYLKLQASQMQVYLAQGNLTRLNQVLKHNFDTLSEAYLDTRQAIDDLRLTPQQGVRVWLEQMLAEFEAASGLPVERLILPAGEDLSPEIQAQLMRIVQETLNNIRKHAGAGRVTVSLRGWNGDLVLEVSDDGQGFSPEDVPALSRYGLRGMHERAELIGADFQVISRAGQGTTVRLSLPIQQQEPQK